MKVGIMQPYIFPYIGYFQLIDAVDTFIIYDDVNFIKRGWINRNSILLNGKAHKINIPLQKISQNKKINEHFIVEDDSWKTKLLTTLQIAYKKAPCFAEVYPIIEDIIHQEEKNIATFITYSLQRICAYLNIETVIKKSSISHPETLSLKGSERIVKICTEENASLYINAIGGMELYNVADFETKNIELKFIKTESITYTQFGDEFLPYLSIIDVMMFNDVSQIQEFLKKRTLLHGE